MDDMQNEVRRLESQYSRNKEGLRNILKDELGDAYGRELPTNLEVEFVKVCYSQIAPDEDPVDRLRRDDENFSEQWVENTNPQKVYLKALRLLLCERVGRSKHDLISGQTVSLLAQIVVAIRSAEDWERSESQSEERSSKAPKRTSRPEPPFGDTFPFGDIYSSDLPEWIHQQKSSEDGDYAVYVLDCTPSINDEERDVIRSLRGEVYEEEVANLPREKAAQAANNNECVYYVGKTDDIPHRMELHDKGQSSGGAKFTEVFKPTSILEVSWQMTDYDARIYEKQRAEELTEPGGPYAFSETVDEDIC